MTEIVADPGVAAGSARPSGKAVVTVGTFDGVHLGHQAVLSEVRRVAEASGMRSVLVTFDPHPLRIVKPHAAPPLLTTREEKEEILAGSGLDTVVFLPFDRTVADYSPRRFVEEILIGHFGLGHLVIGHDHGLGRGRSGDVDALRKIGWDLGFDVDVVPAVRVDGAPISSTRIRDALIRGDALFAARGLGRAYSVRGTVVPGDRRGRAIGFPTANVALPSPEKLLPREGIYAARVDVGGRRLDGVLHLGPRPTIEGASATLEVHLFDFDGDLYGAEVRIRFCEWLRGIEAFDSLEALAGAIEEDCAAARRVLAAGGGACQGLDELVK